MSLAQENLCRICLEDGAAESIFGTDHFPTYLMIMSCSSVQINENDGLPSMICNECLKNLNVAYNFKQQCETTDLQLKQFLSSVGRNSDDKTDDYRKDIYVSQTDEEDEADTHSIQFEYDTNSVLKFSTQQPDYEQVGDKNCDIYEVCEILDPSADNINLQAIVSQECNSDVYVPDQNYVSKNPDLFITSPDVTTDTSSCKTRKEKKIKPLQQCSECGKVFKHSSYLQAHLRIHSGEKPYECEFCSKKFTQQGNLILHRRIHSGEKKFQCEICSKRFKTSSHLNSHLKVHDDGQWYECSICKQIFKLASSLSSHMETHSGIKSHICNICSKEFQKKIYLNVHVRTVHQKEKKFSCGDCGKLFFSSSNLICHRRIHTGEKPFDCKICDARFNQSSSLQRHKRQHFNKATDGIEV